jgi:NodT family efflux transporter outer membrane factor (OMF) lipoprotein
MTLALGAWACAPTPRLAIAPSVLAPEWRDGASGGSVPLEAAWGAFGSPELVALVTRAVNANADIAVASARVIQARGQLGIARAASLPNLSLSGNAGAYSGSDDRSFELGDQSVGLDIAYEVDLFGGVRAGKRAARARMVASSFERDAVALAIESDVTRGYVQHAAFSTRIRLLERALDNARELDRIIGVRVREGVATKVDAGLQIIEVRRIEAEISRLVEARTRTRNALAILIGEEAPRFAAPDADLDALSAPAFRTLQPGELLSRRPDVRAAEAQIAAANGDVERARAAFLPGLRLSAGSLLGAGSAGPLGLGASVGAGLLAPIFGGGRLKGDLLSASGAQRETVERYRKALLVALGEGENALNAGEQSQRRGALLAETLTVARTTARLARRQYVEGAADLQTLLNAERSALDIEDALAVATQERLEAAIDLYKALGGRPAQVGET